MAPADTETISQDIDVIVADYDERANGRSSAAADLERKILRIENPDEQIVDHEAEEY